MIALSQDRTKTLLAIHGWSGVILGLLLYAVILTGVVAVFADEIGDWSSPQSQAQATPLPTGMDAKLRELAQRVDPKYLEEVTLYPRSGGVIQAFFHHHVTPPGKTQPEAFGTQFDLHPRTLAVLDQRDGFFDDIVAGDRVNALRDFLVELHVSLHIPAPWGFLVTGILGLTMMVAAVTGLLVHRHLLKELFTIRRLKQALLARRDAHVIAGTWNLPFAFVLAFTGSYFSFASSIGIPMMAMVAFGGDQEQLIETIVGQPPPENKAAQALGDLDAVLADVRARVHSEPAFVSLSHLGRADAQITVFTRPADGELLSHNLVYEGASGEFQRSKPGLGLVPSLGGAAADLMGPLHFGNFAGLLSKSVWFALGFASCYVALTGLLLWTTRRAESLAWRRMARAAIWMGYGLPLSLALAAVGYFAAQALGLATLEAPMMLSFLGAALVAAVLGGLLEVEPLRRVLLSATGLVLIALPVVRWACGGPGWLAAIDASLITVPAFDLALLIGGALCLRACGSRTAHSTTPADDDSAETAA